jgi:DNA-binding response OmpR family regulator
MPNLVFIVEDNPAQQRILREHFEQSLGNYVVKTFDTPQDMMSNIHLKPFAIVLDHFFGEKSQNTGVEYLRELRSKRNKTPVIYYTTLDDDKVRKEVLDLGAEAYIIKNSASLVRLRTTLDLLHEKVSKKGFFKKLFG